MTVRSEQDYIEENQSLRKIIVEQSQKIQALEEEIARLKKTKKVLDT